MNTEQLKRKREYDKCWTKNHLAQVREKVRRWRKANPEKAREIEKRRRMKNPAEYHKKHKQWRVMHLEKVREYNRRGSSKYRQTKHGALSLLMGAAIWDALRENKRGHHWESLVGYTVEDLRKHLESLFKNGMSWENRCFWHIDHIVPKSRFHYKTSRDPEFKVCWGLANLQPLWAKDNLQKHAKTMEEWKKAS